MKELAQRATSARYFAKYLSALAHYQEQRARRLGGPDISLAQINRTILRNLHSDPPILTTIKQLWNSVGIDTQYSDFSRMLTILAQCGGALVSQKKVYLRIDER